MGPISRMPPILIFDLYEKIARNLRILSYYSTLVALSSTCHAIRPLCLKELFHSISILPRICDARGTKGYSSDDDIAMKYLEIRLRDLERLISRDPRTAAYVRALNIQSHRSNFGDAGLLKLLPIFDCLTVVSLSTFYVPRDEIIWGTAPSVKPFRFFVQEWAAIPVPLAGALGDLICLESVDKVEVQYFQGIPAWFFSRRRRIASLSLIYCSAADSQGGAVEQPYAVQIEALEFGLGPKSIAPLLRAKCANRSALVDTSSLVSISMHLDSETEDLMEGLFELHGVRHLYIDSRENSYSNVPVLFSYITPGFLRTLESLRLHFTWRTYTMRPQTIVFLTDIYAGLSGLSVLTQFQLCIVVQNVKHSPELMSDMACLDELLATERQFLTLRRVTIGVYFDLNMSTVRGSMQADRTRWLGLKSTHFPRLLAKPSLELDVVVRV